MHISSSYAKILGEKLLRTWEIPRSGSKAKDGKEKKKRRKKKRPKVCDNNGQLRIATPPRVAHAKPPGPKKEKDRKLVITIAKLRMAHASMHGARKPPGPIKINWRNCYNK